MPVVGRQLQPGPAADARDASSAWRPSRARRSSRPCPTPARPPSWRAATSTSARPSTWPPTRAASSRPGVERRGRLLRHDARPHPRPRALGADAPAGARRGRRSLTPPRRQGGAGPGAARGEVAARPQARDASSWSRWSSTRRSGADPGAILERAQYCKENEVDAINVADGPRASARMSAQALCVLLQDEGGDRHHPPLHLPRPEPARDPVRPAGRLRARPAQHPRDHRRPAQARRLPGRDRGLRRRLDRPHPDHGPPEPRLRPGGQPDRARRSAIHVGCGADPSKPDMEKEVRRLEEKVEARRRVRHDPARLRPDDRSSASSR